MITYKCAFHFNINASAKKITILRTSVTETWYLLEFKQKLCLFLLCSVLCELNHPVQMILVEPSDRNVKILKGGPGWLIGNRPL